MLLKHYKIIGAAVVVIAGLGYAIASTMLDTAWRTDIQHHTDKHDVLADDAIDSKTTTFEPELVDSRPIGDGKNQWQVNASEAVLSLDIAETRSDSEQYLLTLHPSYAAAAAEFKSAGKTLLPSINMLDGKAKQFDDGLYAELDAALTRQKLKAFVETEGLVRGILENLDKAGDAYAWLLAALQAGEFLNAQEAAHVPPKSAQFLANFDRDEVQSKPAGFYTWSKDLQQTFRFLRFLQQPLPDSTLWNSITQELNSNPALKKQYDGLLDFYAHLTNPSRQKSMLDATASGPRYFLPSSTSRETELFERMFPNRIPAGTDLMIELVKAIRDGMVDLKPKPNSGWYDYQVYALETLLLPQRGAEKNKLLLTHRYKQRLLEAFEAIITKRRETHMREAEAMKCKAERPAGISPRLRVEPNPSYFIRQARAYAFLENYLTAVLPGDVAKSLHGRALSGPRATPLMEELAWMRRYFYGLHLISCEDIGLKPQLLKGEADDAADCSATALKWLENWETDVDLAADTRVSVPVAVDYQANRLHLWNTLGVRGAKLDVSYALPPRWRQVGDAGAGWEKIESYNTQPAHYVILVDEYASVERNSLKIQTREEFRALCDRAKTKERIVEELKK